MIVGLCIAGFIAGVYVFSALEVRQIKVQNDKIDKQIDNSIKKVTNSVHEL